MIRWIYRLLKSKRIPIATFFNQYGDTINVYSGVDKKANKRLSEAKIKSMKMAIDNGL